MANTKTIVLDPGHGGKDPGAVNMGDPANPYDDVTESRLALQIAFALKTYFEENGWNAVMTRSSDIFVPLKKRVAIANDLKADLFMSLHFNASANAKASGFEVYHDNNSVKGKDWSSFIEKAFKKELGDTYKFRGIFPDNLSQHHNLTVLSDTNMPAILVEGGFVSNKNDLAFLKTNFGAICRVLVDGSEKYYEAWKKSGNKPVRPDIPKK